jgi:hypothetical protein
MVSVVNPEPIVNVAVELSPVKVYVVPVNGKPDPDGP